MLSAFTGAGGLDIGLEAAGFGSLGCIEVDPDARETLALNRPDWDLLVPEDIVEYASQARPADFGLEPGDLDLLAAGPPCQPFSAAGQWTSAGRNGLSDMRHAGAFDAFLDLIRAFQPKAVLIENVPGFVSGPASALSHLETRLSGLPGGAERFYTIHTQTMDAADCLSGTEGAE